MPPCRRLAVNVRAVVTPAAAWLTVSWPSARDGLVAATAADAACTSSVVLPGYVHVPLVLIAAEIIVPIGRTTAPATVVVRVGVAPDETAPSAVSALSGVVVEPPEIAVTATTPSVAVLIVHVQVAGSADAFF